MKNTFIVVGVLVCLVGCTASASPVAAPTLTPQPTAMALPTATLQAMLAPQPTPTPGLPPGDFYLIDPGSNMAFKGTIRGQGDLVVVMANQGNNDTYLWEALVNRLAEKGFVAVNFTYTTSDTGIASTELDQVLDYLNQKGNYQRIVCIGGSMGGTACGTVAHRPELAGIALLAGGDSPDLSDVKYPKLFITGEHDACCAGFMATAYEQAAEPKELKIFPGTSAHAVDLFNSEFSDELLGLLISFVQKMR